MKTRKSVISATFLVLVTFLCTASTCSVSQAGASATYIAAEVATTAIIQKNPTLIPTVSLLTADWTAFQGGKLTSAQETTLLQSIVAGTKGQLTPVEAAALDGATQQIIGNQNSSAPTPLQGSAAAIITDVINGAARAVAIYVPPAS